MQPPKTATRRTPLNATTNLSTRRIGVTVAVAGGLAVAMLAAAAPAAAINPGGGRHRVQVERQQQSSQRQQASSTTSASAATSAVGSFLDQELYRLRMCESHNNYQDNTGNGYYGAYQFALQTWQDLGLTGRPDQASPAVQDYAAKVLHSHAGWNPWPACSQREHLR